MYYTILRLAEQSQDWTCNVRIPRMCSAMSKLHKFLTCAEHIHTPVLQIPNGKMSKTAVPVERLERGYIHVLFT